ncbi:MAG TPA: primosomal protein N', partial [Steroidobacteraceae bacterium]
MTATILRIALDTPLRRLFDYLAPKERPAPKIGARVRVPFGRQRLIGVVIAQASSSDLPAEKLKAVLDVIDEEPVLDERVMELAEWAAQYYHHPL